MLRNGVTVTGPRLRSFKHSTRLGLLSSLARAGTVEFAPSACLNIVEFAPSINLLLVVYRFKQFPGRPRRQGALLMEGNPRSCLPCMPCLRRGRFERFKTV
jgi:hypothetical protein